MTYLRGHADIDLDELTLASRAIADGLEALTRYETVVLSDLELEMLQRGAELIGSAFALIRARRAAGERMWNEDEFEQWRAANG